MSLTNKEIAKLLKLTASLLELHDENPFKIRTYSNAVFNVEKCEEPLVNKDQAQLESIDGIGKGLAKSIVEIQNGGSFALLDELIANTPKGIMEMVDLKGFGPKKIKQVWKELNIESIDELYEACKSGLLAGLKGFGAKTQETLLQNLEFIMSYRGMVLYADAEVVTENLLQILKQAFPKQKIEFTGAYRRKVDIISSVDILIESLDQKEIISALAKDEDISYDEKSSGPFSLRGKILSLNLDWHVRLTDPTEFSQKWMLTTGSGAHLSAISKDGQFLHQYLLDQKIGEERQAYSEFEMPYISPELREGVIETSWSNENGVPELLELSDLKGPVHNHSNYSDGQNTIRQLADYCIAQGYEYLGLSDHSKSAFYADGLQEFRIKQQHEEIDELNQELAPFKILKGIESDILNDGSLDYDNDVLASFDFIVASVHSNLNMDLDKATNRLLKAIENPYTTMLGHPTGRLQLRRKGYPIDHKKVIDACAANGVIIEINANPWRLDLDWRWVPYALEKGVTLSINPDAHEIEGFNDMKYGVYAGRKGGLTKEMTFNAWSLDQVEAYLTKRKENIPA